MDMKNPPKEIVDTMAADEFFAYAAELLKVNPPHGTDHLTMRLYAPTVDVLTGKWSPPGVSKVEPLPSLTAQ